MNPQPPVLFDEEKIRGRIQDLGAEIGRAYEGSEICVVGLMKSCLVFMADLIRAIPCELTCHMLRVDSDAPTGSERPSKNIVYYAQIPFNGRHVLLLDDVVATGITLDFILDHIRELKPRSLRTCVLVDLPAGRRVSVTPNWAAFTIDEPCNHQLVGYGLDSGEHYRGLAYIGSMPRSARAGGEPSGQGVFGGTETS